MVYLHVPFCRSFCTYCDFYSELCGGDASFRTHADAVCEEIAGRGEEIRTSREVDTLYVGGGTPSVLPLDVLTRIVGEIIRARGGVRDFREFTVEVNPEDIFEKGEAYVSALRHMGADRISMGIQSFDDPLLRWMNRRHDSARALEAFRTLRRAGVGNISIDLIFGMPQLTDEIWRRTLETALDLSPEHISAYQLSVEPGSALARMESLGTWTAASETQCMQQYGMLCEALSEAGYHHYEVSNFARPGFEAVHNSAYWRRVPYVGLGPGAHSLSGNVRRWNSQHMPSYSYESETLSSEQVRLETIMLSLRTDTGVSEDFLREGTDNQSVDRLLGEGALVRADGRLCIPEDRFFVSDEIIRELV